MPDPTRIVGANDGIRLGQLGSGDRSEGHVHMVSLATRQVPVETVAVCDLWSLARERRAAQVKKAFHMEPRSDQYSEQLLAQKKTDGVMMATGDLQHARLCADVLEAARTALFARSVYFDPGKEEITDQPVV